MKINRDGKTIEPVELSKAQSAERNTCGSCFHYKRIESWDARGVCHLEFPPSLQKTITATMPRDGYEDDPRTSFDDKTCSFWKASGKTYIRIAEAFCVM